MEQLNINYDTLQPLSCKMHLIEGYPYSSISYDNGWTVFNLVNGNKIARYRIEGDYALSSSVIGGAGFAVSLEDLPSFFDASSSLVYMRGGSLDGASGAPYITIKTDNTLSAGFVRPSSTSTAEHHYFFEVFIRDF